MSRDARVCLRIGMRAAARLADDLCCVALAFTALGVVFLYDSVRACAARIVGDGEGG